MVIGSIGGALSELFKVFHFMQNAGCNGNQKEKFKIFLSKTTGQI